MGWLGFESEWNGSGLGEEILIFGRELGLDKLKWGVGIWEGMEMTESA
jgi:hypothetical protein